MSQHQVATRIGITAAAVGQWESDDGTEPTHDNLAAFCEALGISLSQFWGPTPSAPRQRKTKAA